MLTYFLDYMLKLECKIKFSHKQYWALHPETEPQAANMMTVSQPEREERVIIRQRKHRAPMRHGENREKGKTQKQ